MAKPAIVWRGAWHPLHDSLLTRCAGAAAGARAQPRYDPHTPPLVPRAGSLRGGGADASNGARLVSTSVFTPSLGHPHHEVPVDISQPLLRRLPSP
jgi:hypothetical protein